MEDVLPPYDVTSPAWFYLSLLLIVAVFFRFTRLWSLRNLDLLLLLGFSPALLFLEAGRRAATAQEAATASAVGNGWLFALSGVLLIRLFCDSLYRRRPRLDQNLNAPAIGFLALGAMVLLIFRVATLPLPDSTVQTVQRGEQMRLRIDASAEKAAAGPATSLLAAPVGAISEAVTSDDNEPGPHAGPSRATLIAAHTLAVLAHLAVVAALFMLGMRIFGEPQIGLSMALLYLLLPCTFYQAGEVIHVLPAALVLWAFVVWDRPLAAGVLLGLACGTLFFPVFLVPLWAVFYGRRRAGRFLAGVLSVGAVLLASLALTSYDPTSFTRQAFGAINWSALSLEPQTSGGFWSEHNHHYRLPTMAAFAVMLVVLTVWPRRKSLEHLLASSTALVVGVQFWYPQEGGVYLLWHLPLTLAVMFRPTLSALTAARPQPDHRPQTAIPAGRQLVTTNSSTALFH
jgi:hypothetical protein